jgi:hypothetical protein
VCGTAALADSTTTALAMLLEGSYGAMASARKASTDVAHW